MFANKRLVMKRNVTCGYKTRASMTQTLSSTLPKPQHTRILTSYFLMQTNSLRKRKHVLQFIRTLKLPYPISKAKLQVSGLKNRSRRHIKQNQKKPMPFGKSILPYLTIWIACSMRAIQRKR